MSNAVESTREQQSFMDMNLISVGLVWIAVFLFSTTAHEAAHALAAWWLGDSTAYEGGQVTLDPRPHIRREPVGMLVVPLLTCFFNQASWVMGWASCPYDPRWAWEYPRRAALMALAGPLSNLLICVAAALLIRAGLALELFVPPAKLNFTAVAAGREAGVFTAVALLISVLFSMNLILFVFNLFPLPPLDGSAALNLVLPEKLARGFQEFLYSNPMFALLGLLAVWTISPPILLNAFVLAVKLLYPELFMNG